VGVFCDAVELCKDGYKGLQVDVWSETWWRHTKTTHYQRDSKNFAVKILL
jgi:uncharacterized protein YraI